MKITKQQLEKLIKEAVKKKLNEGTLGDSEFGSEPLISDYSSLKEILYKTWERMKKSQSMSMNEVESYLVEAAKYGYSKGWDKAWTEVENQRDSENERL